jgi:hypothetical protein
MKKIQSVTVTASTAAAIEFTAIPGTFDDLAVFLSTRVSTTGGDGTESLLLQFNGDTGSNYSWRRVRGDGSGAASTSGTSVTAMTIGYTNAAAATASTFGNGLIYIPNYAGSTNKSVSSDTVSENNATAAYQAFIAGLWSSTAAITSIKIYQASGNIVQYSTATLYGIRKS